MGLGLFIGFLSVLILGLLIGAFGWYAAMTTGHDRYVELNCAENYASSNTTLNRLCSASTGGQWVGIGAWIIAFLFIVIGFIGTLITGIKLAVDSRKEKKTTT